MNYKTIENTKQDCIIELKNGEKVKGFYQFNKFFNEKGEYIKQTEVIRGI